MRDTIIEAMIRGGVSREMAESMLKGYAGEVRTEE